jgi:Amino acid synthesis
MSVEIRKIVRYVEDVFAEGGRSAPEPPRMVMVAAVLRNPWAGRGFVENLRPEIMSVAPDLADKLVAGIIQCCGSAERVEAYGKAAVVGSSGEIEHASALIHTLRFGNRFRDAVGGKSYLSFTNKRGGPGCVISVPMMHKLDEGRRSHYLTIECCIADAPGPEEIVVALGAATGGRPHARIGDRYLDMKEMADERSGAMA